MVSGESIPCRAINYFILAIAKEGKTVVEIRIDEEGAIIRNATFINMIVEKFPSIRIITTGGYASSKNVKVKRSHKTLKNANRVTLMDTNKEKQ
eukprot:10413587-Ditylum_brightwellii.AAC.1